VPRHDLAKLNNVGVKGFPVDFNEPSLLDGAMKDARSVFMLLPMAPDMLDWAKNIVDSCLRNGVRFILRSSLMDAAPGSDYFLFDLHGTIDSMVRDSGIPYAIVHPNAFMQNFVVYYAGTINSQDAFYFTQRPRTRVSYVDVRDIAAVDSAILKEPQAHAGREYTLTGPSALTNDDIAAALSNAAGREIRYVELDKEQYTQGLLSMGMSEWAVRALLSLDDHVNDGKQEELTADLRRVARRDPIAFDRFVRDYAPAWKKAPLKAAAGR
jgi:uncharacterized protein YbjT (DUF2867 family)